MGADYDLRELSPGQLIRALLKERGWTQTVLATVTGLEQSTISRIAQDKRSIDAHAALVFSDTFAVPAEDFLEAQKHFDLARAREETKPDPDRARQARLFAQLPVREMVKRGWLAVKDVDVRDAAKVEAAVVRFFGVSSPEEIDEVLPHSAKKTDVGGEVTAPQQAWLQRVKVIAEEQIVPRRYSPSAVRAAVEKLATLRSSVADARKAPAILAEAGVRFIVVESLSGARIDGVCFWLNDMAPVIGVTLRHDRVDNFWFVLRHEIEHVLKGHGRRDPMIDVEIEDTPTADIPEEERIANEAAADFCVPADQMERFIRRKSPFFMERDILGFAATLKIHPGLVVGQLQHKTGRYDRFRNHLVKIRNVVLPSAAADGWGSPYPLDN